MLVFRAQQDKKSFGSDTSHEEKAVFFFEDKKSFGSDTSHEEKAVFFFEDKKSFERHIAIF